MRIDVTNIPEKCIIILYYWISLVWSIDSGNTYKKLMRGVRISMAYPFSAERLQMQKDVETVSHFMQAWMFPLSTVSLECC